MREGRGEGGEVRGEEGGAGRGGEERGGEERGGEERRGEGRGGRGGRERRDDEIVNLCNQISLGPAPADLPHVQCQLS